MLRKLAVSLAVAGIISASNANALGLGEIKINSALNEPLNAEIKLLQVRKLGPLQIQPRMADIDEFALAGLEKSRLLSDVSFHVKVNPDGSGVITLKSDRPVKEPFLNFLVEVNWPNGRLVREYTLLLDPPVFDPTPVRKTVQPSAATSPGKPVAQVSSAPISSSSNRSSADSQSQVRVKNRDTLWGIAIKHRPSKDIPVQKMMIALQKKNPDAFINGNINALRAGVILDLPSSRELNELSNRTANQEYVRQTTDWKKQPEKAPIEASKKKPVTGPAPEPAPVEDKAAELKIVTPKETLEPEEGVKTDQSDVDEQSVPEQTEAPAVAVADDPEKNELLERNQELEDRLNQSLENVDKITRENADLNDRLDGIQYELEKLREMLELKDKELASLQNQVEQAKAAPPPPPPEKSMIDKIMDSPAILGGVGAGVIALLGGLLFFMRRRKDDDESGATEENALVQMPADLEDTSVSEEPEAAVEEEVASVEEEAVEDAQAADSDLDDLSDLDFDADADDLELGDEESLLEEGDLNLDDDLDLDMDLDLEEDASGDVLQTVDSNVSDDLDDLLNDDEFDLGLEDDLDEPESEVAEDLDDALDSILDDEASVESEAEVEEEPDALDDILGEIDDVEPESALSAAPTEEAPAEEVDLGLEDDLEFDLSDSPSDEAASAEPEVAEDSADDDLDFVVDEMPDLGADEETETVTEELDESGLDDLLNSVDEIEDLSDLSSEEDEAAEQEIAVEADAVIEEFDETDASIEAMLSSDPEPEEQVVTDMLDEQLDDPAEVESDEGLDALLAEVDEELDMSMADDLEAELKEREDQSSEESASVSELDSMLDEIGVGLDDVDLSSSSDEADVGEVMLEDDLAVTGEADLEADLESDLDSELDALLGGSDEGIDLEETSTDEEALSMGDDFDELAGLNLLEGADEVETKLDLARAYMDMEDLEGAQDILQEIVAEGNEQQQKEAQALLQSMKDK